MHDDFLTITIPDPRNVLRSIQSFKSSFSVGIELSSTTLRITTNSKQFAETAHQHFHICSTKFDQEVSLPPQDEIFLLSVAKDSDLLAKSVQILVKKVPDKKSTSWIGECNGFEVYIQEPDLVLYTQLDSGATFALDGRIWDTNAPENALQQGTVGEIASFTMICDHLYLWIAKKCQSVCLHGACALYNGKTFLIVGESGAGKTTTALSMLREGATLLSEEIVLLQDVEGHVFAEGLPILPKLVSNAPVSLDKLESSLSLTADNKQPIHPNDLENCAGIFGKKCSSRVDNILFLAAPKKERSPDHTLSPIDEMQAFEKLNAQILAYNMTQHAGLRVNTILNLASTANSYEFKPGSSIQTILSFLDEHTR